MIKADKIANCLSLLNSVCSRAVCKDTKLRNKDNKANVRVKQFSKSAPCNVSNEVVVIVVLVVGGRLRALLHDVCLRLPPQKQMTARSVETVAEKQESNAL